MEAAHRADRSLKAMTASNAWLNREKLACLAVAAALAVVGAWAVWGRPEFPDPGEQRTARGAPGALRVTLDQPEDLKASLAGDRDPFGHQAAATPTESDRVKGTKTKITVDAGVYPFPDVDRGIKAGSNPGPIHPYQVPVNFMGVYRLAPSGECRVLLKGKRSGENRWLVAGDEWPETGLRVVRITESSVDLRNEKGELFRMLDLYGRRAADGAQGLPARLAGA